MPHHTTHDDAGTAMPTKGDGSTAQVCGTIESTLEARLKAVAKDKERSMSWCIAKAIEEWVIRQERE